MKKLCWLGILSMIAWGGVPAGRSQTAEPPPAAETVDVEASTVQSLEALLQTLLSQEQEAAKVQQQLIAAPDEVTRQELAERLKNLRAEAEEGRQQFERFAVDIDLSPFVEEVKTGFDWQQEVGKLLKPIMAEFEAATAETRALGMLREKISDVGERLALAETAVANIERLRAQAESAALQARLDERLAYWTRLRDNAANEHKALELQLQNRLGQKKSLLDSTTGYAKNFVRTRGLNLVYGIGAFCAVFFGLRALAAFSQRRKKAKNFRSRLAALVLHLASILGGLLAMLLVFNMVGDWFLLGLVVIFLLGIGWAGIRTLPQHMEMMKLALNIGTVREGHRLDWDGVPYRVDSLGFSARLVNPLLDGGVQMLPVLALVGRYSRPPGEREEWFPTRPGDWVELSDGQTGRVAYQTPSAVQLVALGGAQTVYPTAAFVALNPRNLSTNFRVSETFGIGYRHQAIATTEVPRVMRERIENELVKGFGRERVLDVQVSMKAAGASSLDYEIRVDVKGELAPQAGALRSEIQRILVDACNEKAWDIPFPQLTVHQAT